MAFSIRREKNVELDEKFDETKLSEIFGQHDANGDGQLVLESFGAALFECLSLMKEDNADEQQDWKFAFLDEKGINLLHIL